MADIKDPKNTIVMETTQGKVWIELFPDLAPNHVERIKKLTQEHYYDGCNFHRVIGGFMAQTGYRSDKHFGSGYGFLKSEFSKSKHLRGTCSMSRKSDPDSADCQFFICFEDSPVSDGQYTVWGKVIEGMENIDRLERGDPVRNPDKIISMKIVEDPVVTPGRNQDEDIDPETKLIKQQTVQQSSTSVLGPTKQLPVDVLK
ncbi:peptidylprolyl isomerase [Pseudomonas sp. TH49]|jgi:peptidylprolyl isomerase|uniref:peptidylprolyl isomerase n=1 Tax=unclassified Pseudomonas TaxID=196821 RepID=UPI000CD4FF16|nr:MULTISPECIES: peptidylprolyl isomerase [unclassified Pseudomonas]MBK5341557.1 peptidylprolyl isomerase [Pseudomonas sp. TH49]RBC02738.1 peptidylprolyl isomerase [Pseudomonas sp. MWU12-2115]